ncbi:MAG: hypothetical protein IJN29_08115 [Akkermansia sp.]|nr:hypothetical protein [Akkermansia sp.]
MKNIKEEDTKKVGMVIFTIDEIPTNELHRLIWETIVHQLVTYRRLAFDLKQYMEFVEKRGIENVDWNEVRKEFGSCVYTIDD